MSHFKDSQICAKVEFSNSSTKNKIVKDLKILMFGIFPSKLVNFATKI